MEWPTQAGPRRLRDTKGDRREPGLEVLSLLVLDLPWAALLSPCFCPRDTEHARRTFSAASNQPRQGQGDHHLLSPRLWGLFIYSSQQAWVILQMRKLWLGEVKEFPSSPMMEVLGFNHSSLAPKPKPFHSTTGPLITGVQVPPNLALFCISR